MEFAVLGWPPDGPTLELPWRRFRYAGKFVMTNTGKAVARTDDEIVGAAAFNEDRSDPEVAWIRYLTVRDDRRGTGIGPQLVEFLVEALADRAYDTARIAVNNPFAYEALYKAGFSYSGRQTGLAELVLDRELDIAGGPVGNQDAGQYRQGLRQYLERDLPPAASRFAREKLRRGTPPPAPQDRTRGPRT